MVHTAQVIFGIPRMCGMSLQLRHSIFHMVQQHWPHEFYPTWDGAHTDTHAQDIAVYPATVLLSVSDANTAHIPSQGQSDSGTFATHVGMPWQVEAEEQLRNLNHAYEVLGDEHARAQYDAQYHFAQVCRTVRVCCCCPVLCCMHI